MKNVVKTGIVVALLYFSMALSITPVFANIPYAPTLGQETLKKPFFQMVVTPQFLGMKAQLDIQFEGYNFFTHYWRSNMYIFDAYRSYAVAQPIPLAEKSGETITTQFDSTEGIFTIVTGYKSLISVRFTPTMMPVGVSVKVHENSEGILTLPNSNFKVAVWVGRFVLLSQYDAANIIGLSESAKITKVTNGWDIRIPGKTYLIMVRYRVVNHLEYTFAIV